MIRLLKLVLALVGVGAFVWFGANVALGSHTLFEHLQAIGRTSETKDLLEGTREKARPIVDDVRRRIAKVAADKDEPPAGGGGTAATTGAPPAEEISDKDRQHLRKLIGPGHASR